MKTAKKSLAWLIGIILLGLSVTGCSQVVSGSNFTLGSGQQVNGSLIVLSQNADLMQQSRVTGSVIMLCCNLTADGEVVGSIKMLTGNIKLGPNALLQGNLTIGTGDFMASPGSQVFGLVSTDNSFSILLDMLLLFILFILLIFVIAFTMFKLINLNRKERRERKGYL